jgi:hypothetical protein
MTPTQVIDDCLMVRLNMDPDLGDADVIISALAAAGYAVVPVAEALDLVERIDMWLGDNSDRPGSRGVLVGANKLRAMLAAAAQEPEA